MVAQPEGLAKTHEDYTQQEAEAKRAKEIFAAAVQGETASMNCLRGTSFGETSESVHESSNSS